MIKKLPFLLFLLVSHSFAQEIDFSGSVNLQGIISDGEESPFWLHTNKRGRIDEATTFAGWANLRGAYQFDSKTSLEIGVGGLFHDGYTEEFQFDELYLNFDRSWFSAVIGRKQRAELYNGLSATNENIVWSLNARPMPGIRFFTNRPVTIWNEAGLAFEAGLEEYLMDDNRFVDDARVHHKRFHLVFSGIPNFEIKAGVQHFVQWAGTSPDYGKLPGGIDDYFKVLTGNGISGHSEDGVAEQEINGLGNHLGSYEIYLSTSIENYDLQVFWNHIFEDGSSSQLKNTPDGRYGLFISDTEPDKWVNSFMYEFYYTRNQSAGSLTTDGSDNYFHNHLYRSGWTYESRILGVPFVTLNDTRSGIANNKFIVHHIGLSGIALNNFPYKLLASYRKNYGGKGTAYIPNDVFSTYLDVRVLQAYVDFNVQLGGDFSSDEGSNLGIGLNLSKNLF